MKYFIAKDAKALIDADNFNGSFLDAEIDGIMLTGNAGTIVKHWSLYLRKSLYTVHYDYSVTLCTLSDIINGNICCSLPYEIKEKSLKMIYFDFDKFLETVEFEYVHEKSEYFDIALEHIIYSVDDISSSVNADTMMSKLYEYIMQHKSDIKQKHSNVGNLFSRTRTALYKKHCELEGAVSSLSESIEKSDKLYYMGVRGYTPPKIKDWTESERIQKDWKTYMQTKIEK